MDRSLRQRVFILGPEETTDLNKYAITKRLKMTTLLIQRSANRVSTSYLLLFPKKYLRPERGPMYLFIKMKGH